MDHSKFIKAVKIHEHEADFKGVLLYSPVNQEIIISFSGPKSTDNKFYKKLWSEGFSKFHDLNIETPYVSDYNNITKTLKESLKKLEQEYPLIKDFKFIFVGHSFGGSLAVLSAYDIISTKFVGTFEIRAPIVNTYGQLRIGDSDFVGKVN
jgi:predicted alpha/beta hydrolase family esterase